MLGGDRAHHFLNPLQLSLRVVPLLVDGILTVQLVVVISSIQHAVLLSERRWLFVLSLVKMERRDRRTITPLAASALWGLTRRKGTGAYVAHNVDTLKVLAVVELMALCRHVLRTGWWTLHRSVDRRVVHSFVDS